MLQVFDFLLKYPSVLLAVIGISPFVFATLLADKCKSRLLTLSDLSCKDRDSKFWTNLSMISTAVIIVYMVYEANEKLLGGIGLSFYLVCISSFLFAAIPIFLDFGKYKEHYVVIGFYLIFNLAYQLVLGYSLYQIEQSDIRLLLLVNSVVNMITFIILYYFTNGKWFFELVHELFIIAFFVNLNLLYVK